MLCWEANSDEADDGRGPMSDEADDGRGPMCNSPVGESEVESVQCSTTEICTIRLHLDHENHS